MKSGLAIGLHAEQSMRDEVQDMHDFFNIVKKPHSRMVKVMQDLAMGKRQAIKINNMLQHQELRKYLEGIA